ncbi:polypyrimidine tract-binding protein homolog 3 [Tanacetum coccineum]
MASGGSDQNAEYALSKLLQIGTVAEYESEFVILANRVTGISANILKSFYIFELKLELQRELFRSMPTTLGEAFSLARIAKTRFEDERYVEKVVIFQKSAHVQVLIQFQSRQNVIVARNSLQGCNIYEGCCLDIQFSNLEELQENQEEHICYYCWENCFSILNTKEASNTKSPLFADTYGNSGVDDTESKVVTDLLEEFQEGDMVDALSRVLE